METRLALVIVVDGLRASALGTYGNTTFPTPNFDSLAGFNASPAVIDNALILRTFTHLYRVE